jgi:hypothetical protein
MMLNGTGSLSGLLCRGIARFGGRESEGQAHLKPCVALLILLDIIYCADPAHKYLSFFSLMVSFGVLNHAVLSHLI